LLLAIGNITSETFSGFAQGNIANISASSLARLEELYPKGSNEAEEYKRVADLVQDVLINCNVVALAKAFGDDTYRYVFNVSRAWHGDDVFYNFYNPGFDVGALPIGAPPISAWAAKVHQEYLTDYTVKGDPGCADTLPCFTKYGTEESSLMITDEKVEILSADPWNNERCDFLINGVWES
jgi:carboxylesterase type B